MARRTKMIIATLATVLVATMGAAGVSDSATAGGPSSNRTNNEWCC